MLVEDDHAVAQTLDRRPRIERLSRVAGRNGRRRQDPARADAPRSDHPGPDAARRGRPGPVLGPQGHRRRADRHLQRDAAEARCHPRPEAGRRRLHRQAVRHLRARSARRSGSAAHLADARGRAAPVAARPHPRRRADHRSLAAAGDARRRADSAHADRVPPGLGAGRAGPTRSCRATTWQRWSGATRTPAAGARSTCTSAGCGSS